ncbi:MAG TPA: peptide ABC transporter substrate-binding protein, partial [Myxococcales bacterium]|nr:peptide ABC transporter substrate-binding protein [Myxococcales bacterium]
MRASFAAILCFALLLPSPGFAAGRPRYGGTLRVALASPAPDADPLNVDRPETAALAALLSPPLCRLDPVRGPLPEVAEISRPQPNRLLVAFRGGNARRAADLTARWNALSQAATLSPYRALLAPLRAVTPSGGTVEAALAYPWPDLERTLCHPALGLGDGGPYAPAAPRGPLTANLAFPEGRPFPDRLQILSVDERRASRLFSMR